MMSNKNIDSESGLSFLNNSVYKETVEPTDEKQITCDSSKKTKSVFAISVVTIMTLLLLATMKVLHLPSNSSEADIAMCYCENRSNLVLDEFQTTELSLTNGIELTCATGILVCDDENDAQTAAIITNFRIPTLNIPKKYLIKKQSTEERQAPKG
ncbi:hypothetical protein QYM36_000702 [Artemia franciscana]|uniref:Uncharacterized protein n=1 Tax=Artemia franciscana TaxID=6661 RepID=A0AA88IDM9_ARTSF|nr:hypothetical protein QYM36_000702 [Artemia franciscana]